MLTSKSKTTKKASTVKSTKKKTEQKPKSTTRTVAKKTVPEKQVEVDLPVEIPDDVASDIARIKPVWFASLVKALVEAGIKHNFSLAITTANLKEIKTVETLAFIRGNKSTPASIEIKAALPRSKISVTAVSITPHLPILGRANVSNATKLKKVSAVIDRVCLILHKSGLFEWAITFGKSIEIAVNTGK